MRVISKRESLRRVENAHNEKKALGTMMHPFILEMHTAFKDATNLYLVVEHCIGGELGTQLRKLKTFSEDATRFYLGNIVVALEYIHSLNLIHRGLTPAGCLIASDGYLRIRDFHMAKFLLPGEKAHTFYGPCPEYTAPDIILQKPHNSLVD